MLHEVPQMIPIKEVAKKTGLAEYYIRQCCLKNKIAHIRCGKRILVNYSKFVEFLNTGDIDINEPAAPQGKIRKLN